MQSLNIKVAFSRRQLFVANVYHWWRHCPSSHLHPTLFLLTYFFGWMCDKATSNVLFCLMLWQTYTCQILVPYYQKHLGMCFIQQGIRFTVGLTQMTWLLLALCLISHTQTHTQHIGTNRLTLHMNIYYHLLCGQSRYLLNQSLTDIKNLFCKGQQCFCFSNITHLQKLLICLLDSVARLSPSCETQRIVV